MADVLAGFFGFLALAAGSLYAIGLFSDIARGG